MLCQIELVLFLIENYSNPAKFKCDNYLYKNAFKCNNNKDVVDF